MAELLQLIWSVLTGLFQSRAKREAEIACPYRKSNVSGTSGPGAIWSD
jgi:hypothetical protein